MENTKILESGKPFNAEEQGFAHLSTLTGKLNKTSEDAEVSFYTKGDEVAILTRKVDGSIYSLVIANTNPLNKYSQEDYLEIRKNIDAAKGILAKYRRSSK